MWEFPGSSAVRTPQFHLGGRRWGVCLIPGQGTKVLQAAQCSQKKKVWGGQGKREKNRLGNLERQKKGENKDDGRNERREKIW